MNLHQVAERWYKQALHDLEMARRNLGIEGYIAERMLNYFHQRWGTP